MLYIRSYISLMLTALVLWACAPSTPSDVLSKSDMEAVMYDMYVAQSLYDSRIDSVNKDADIVGLRQSVLKKHGVSQEEWDRSFDYYTRNAEQLLDIYRSIGDRTEANVLALGGKVDGMQGEEADSANVWNGESSLVLMQQSPYNIYTFEITPDSTFADGDRLTLQYDVQFIFQDGNRDVSAMMAVYYDNDSVATATTRSFFDGHGVLTLNNDVDRLHVSKIKGYIMMARGLTQVSSNANSVSMRVAVLRNLKLLHLPTTPPAPLKQEEATDSLKADSLKVDSLKADSMKPQPRPLVTPQVTPIKSKL